MANTFKTENQLKNFLLKKCKSAVSNTGKEVYETFDMNLGNFYGEWHPRLYERKDKLNKSLSFAEATQIGDGIFAEAWFDPEHMDYTTGTWSGETVLDVAMSSAVPHGGYKGGTAIWEESMLTFYNRGGIKEMLFQNLIAQGLPVKKV